MKLPRPPRPHLPKLPKPPVPKFPEEPPPGPTRPSFWKSPLRGPWLTSILGSALLPLILICAVTGFLSQAAYNPNLGHNSLLPGGGLGVSIYFVHWPTSPSWLYAFTQGLHVASGLAAMPILLAKLWSVMPKLFEWPPVRGAAHALERLSLALLVGGSVFVFGTGLLNIQVFYPWPFRFLTAHYYGAFVFLAAFGFHIFLKIPVALRTFRERGVLRPLRPGLAETVAEPYEEGHVAPLEPARPTISRRALLATVGAASLGAAFMAVAQSVGGPLRELGLLTPRSTQLDHGPNGFQINKTAAAVGIGPEQTGAAWRLRIEGAARRELSREQLLALPQHSYDLPIACVEGWSTTQRWTGVRLRDLAAMSGVPGDAEVLVESLQTAGALREVTLSPGQVGAEKSLLALKVNGEDLSLDHGFPARVIVPGAPGVHQTKWVGAMKFEAA
ncbi:MAG TPA: molybdopterin-dependent oxidoreductase [Solirubrobacterales bacterium]|nr:molybdopterin-dependent oxidoreductase [Solirubrobacterales bacterium]